MVDGVADEVGQRVLDGLEQGLVELGLAALHLQPDGLLQLHAEVADDARQLRPDVVDRLHARLHDALLQLAGDEVQPLRRADQVGVGLAGDVLHDLVAGEHQLADEQHQLVEQVDVDPDGAVGDGAAGLTAGAVRRGVRRRLAGLRGDGRPRSGAPRRCSSGMTGVAPSSRSCGVGGAARRPAPRAAFGARGGGLAGGVFVAAAALAGALAGAFAAGPWPGPWRPPRRAGTRGGDGGGRGGGAVLHRGGDRGDDAGDVDPALAAAGLDRGEQRADAVDHLQQHARAGRRQGQLAVPQPGEHVLPDVRDLLEPVEGEEAAGALDGVDRPEDAGQPLAGVGLLLEGDQVGVQLVEVLVALDQELLDDVVQTVHGCCLLSHVATGLREPARLGHRRAAGGVKVNSAGGSRPSCYRHPRRGPAPDGRPAQYVKVPDRGAQVGGHAGQLVHGGAGLGRAPAWSTPPRWRRR